MRQYDALIIGAGQAGPPLAAAFAGMGQRVALAEGNLLGGSCVNYGCTPTKTLRASARSAHMARRSADYGIHTGPVRVDFEAVMARKDRVVAASHDGLENWLQDLEGLDIYREYASFVDRVDGAYTVKLGETQIQAQRVYINTGTRAYVPPIEGLDEVDYLDNVRLLALTELPDHLLILGGGYIGLEMGQIFRRLGSEVTIVEGGAHVAGREDADVCEAIEAFLADEGVRILTGNKAESVSQDAPGVISLQLRNKGGELTTITGSHLLVATGRVPNSDRLNLERIGLQTTDRGYIPTNERLETSLENIWALGDINGRGAFTHTSYQEHEIVLANHEGGQRSAEARNMAYAMFTDPPLGRVGMSESEARKSGRKVLMAVHEMANVSRAKEESETTGLIKLLVDAETEAFLGAAFLGIYGDEIVQIISNFMTTGASYKLIRDALPIHPTVAEFLPTILNRLETLD